MRSRTPHLDRAIARRANTKRVQAWRARNPVRAKVMAIKAASTREQDDAQRHAAAAAFAHGHKHSCIRCRKPYACVNACDAIGEGLDNSICDPCLEEV